MLYGIIFPKLLVTEPLSLYDLTLSPIEGTASEEETLEGFVLKRLPLLISQHFDYVPTYYSACLFDSSDSSIDVLERYYPHLLLLRFAILCDAIHGDYSETEYALFRIEFDNRHDGAVHYSAYINGLEPTTRVLLADRDVPPTSCHPHLSSLEFDVADASRNFIKLDAETQNDVKSGMHRYVLAHGPNRHIDPFMQIIGMVSGIERFVKLGNDQGAKEFGRRLASLFEMKELQAWGSQVYDLRSSLSHQKLELPADLSQRRSESEMLFYANPLESTRHTTHFRIARDVLKELIMCGLFGGPPSGADIQQLFWCQETPIKKMVELAKQNTELGPVYYEYIDLLKRSSPMGGTLDDKKCLVRFVFRELRRRFPDSTHLFGSELDFSNPQALLGQLEAAREWLDPIKLGQPLVFGATGDVNDDIFRYKVAGLLFHIVIPLRSDIHHATSPCHK